MKCRCPACGRSTEIEPALLDFLTRCTRCGVLIKPKMQDAAESLSARVIPVGRTREWQMANGQIADLLSRPIPARAAAVLADPEPIQSNTALALEPPPVAEPQMPISIQRRVQLRERHQTLGIVRVACVAAMALISLAALAIKSKGFFVRTARAQVDVVQPGK